MDYRQYAVKQDTLSGVDVGLRNYMMSVYNYMATGLVITGAIAWLLSTNITLMTAIFTNSGLRLLVSLAPLAIVFFFSARVTKISAQAAQMVFWLFAASMGVSLSSIFLVYTGQSIARVFFISASMFGAMSLYGYTTKKDLTGIGSFLFMGVIGIFFASLVNLFMQSTALSFALSVMGVVVFVGLTAYDTQQIKEIYYEMDNTEVMRKKAIYGALQLYLDFINVFISLLRLFGDRRSS